MSSGVVSRPFGFRSSAAATSASDPGIFSRAAVCVTPAMIAFAVIPRGASSTASCRMCDSRAALAADTAPYEGHATIDHNPSFDFPTPEVMSLARALSAAAVLVDNGVEEHRIQVTGHGADRPRSVANTAESRRDNRRVELRILTLGRARAEQLKLEWRERRQREGGL